MTLARSGAAFAFFARLYPWRTAFTLLALLTAGLLEGIGVATLLPVLSLAGDGRAAGDSSALLQAVDRVFAAIGLAPSLGAMLGVVVAAMVLKGALALVALRQVAHTAAQVAVDLRLALLRALLGARWSYFTSHAVGASANAIGTEATRASEAYLAACQVIALAFQVGVYLLIAVLLSWQTTLATAVVGASIVAALWTLVRQARSAGARQTRTLNMLLARLSDTLFGFKPLKAMAREDRLASLLEAQLTELQAAQRQATISHETLYVLKEPIMALFFAAGTYGAVALGQIALSSLIFVGLLFFQITRRILQVQGAYLRMAAYESAFWSIRDTIDRAEREVEDRVGAGRVGLTRHIALHEVTFSYGDREILSRASGVFPARSFTVIFGPSGSGKTTLVDLIIGLLRPIEGEITVDDAPLRQLDLMAWRRSIGYVPQEMFLFHDSIYHNVTLNDPDITRSDAEAALRAAGAWEFVAALPEGMDTVVGERGMRLSGGQRQRVAIARALVGKPKLLILDEATTALDPATERGILATVKQLSGAVTVIAISHNPAVLDVADRVYCVRNGRLEPRSSDAASVLPVLHTSERRQVGLASSPSKAARFLAD